MCYVVSLRDVWGANEKSCKLAAMLSSRVVSCNIHVDISIVFKIVDFIIIFYLSQLIILKPFELMQGIVLMFDRVVDF